MLKGLRYRNSVTFGVTGFVFAVCLSCFGVNQQGSKRARAIRKTNTEIAVQVTASRSLIKLPPGTPELLPLDCEVTENEVKLNANTISPQSVMNFIWQAPVGRLIGKGREVIWDLRGVQAGTYTVTVEASDRHKHAGSGSITVTIVICTGWRPDPPPCPTVTVSCPSSVESKGSVTFEATLWGVDSGTTYEWSVSAGRIVSGQATRKVTVDVSNLSHESVTATVSLGGLNPLCNSFASCTTEVGETKLRWP